MEGVVAVFFFFVRYYLGDGGTDRREILHDGAHRFRTGLLFFWEPGS